MASLLLYGGLVFIRIKTPELFLQYSSVQRALNPQTIDELIYKGRFFTTPGISMVVWISFASGLVLNILVNKLDIHILLLNGSVNVSSLYYFFFWLMLSGVFFLLFIFRYALVSALASIFDMTNIRNIHFASHLRLTSYLSLFLLVLVTLDYFSVIIIGKFLITGIVFGSLLSIIILIGLRLSFLIRHTFVHLFLYLCGTEIFLFVFVYKLVIG